MGPTTATPTVDKAYASVGSLMTTKGAAVLDRLDTFVADRLAPVGDPRWRSVLALNVLIAGLGALVALVNIVAPGYSLVGAVVQWCCTLIVLCIAATYWLVNRHKARTTHHH